MKNLILLIAVLVSIVSAEKILNVPEQTQQNDQWCWSSTSNAILKYYGETPTQGEEVLFAFGDSTINQWNYTWGTYDIPNPNGGTISGAKGIDLILSHWNTPSTPYYNCLSESEFKAEIDGGHPFVIRWGWYSGGGHVVVGMGYLNGNYQIMDPWYGCGYTINSYNWINTAQGGKGTWTHTLTTQRNPLSTTTYALTISGGTGSGSFASGASAPIVATVPAGKTFVKWSGAGSAISDSLAPTATITMPAKALAVTAVFQASVATKYALAVTGGTGSGSFGSGVSAPIVATVPSGKTFVKWSGAGSSINDSLSPSATITMPAKALAVSAVFQTAVVIDTSNLSKNFVKVGSWEANSDTIGSQITIDRTKKANDTISSSFAIAADNVAFGDDGYAWGRVTSTVDGSYESVDYIKLTYQSNDSVRIVLDDSLTGTDGVSFGMTLPKSLTMKTILIPVKSLTQPDWTPDSLKTTIDLKAITSISFESVSVNKTTTLTIAALQVNKFSPAQVVSLNNSQSAGTSSVAVGSFGIKLTGFSGAVDLEIYSLAGRKLFSQVIEVSGETIVKTPELGTGVHILRVNSAAGSFVLKM